MKCRLKCEKPEAIEYTLTITMMANDWERLRDQLGKVGYTSWPADELCRQIADLLAQATLFSVSSQAWVAAPGRRHYEGTE